MVLVACQGYEAPGGEFIDNLQDSDARRPPGESGASHDAQSSLTTRACSALLFTVSYRIV
eukprot:2623037-Heterocapsa_arctica.AAC.1